MLKIQMRVAAIAAAALVVLAGCAGGPDASGPGGDQKITLGVGVASAVWAPAYIAKSEGFFEKHGVDVTIEDNTGSNTLNALVGGRIDVGAYGGSLPLLASLQGKQTTTLISTAAGGRRDLLGDLATVPEGSLFALNSTAKSKRKAVEGVLAAWNEARAFLLQNAETDPDRIAKILASYPGFSGIRADQLAADVRSTASYNSVPDNGRIDAAVWDLTLKTYATWGIAGFDATDKKLAYENSVDMSFLDASATSGRRSPEER